MRSGNESGLSYLYGIEELFKGAQVPLFLQICLGCMEMGRRGFCSSMDSGHRCYIVL